MHMLVLNEQLRAANEVNQASAASFYNKKALISEGFELFGLVLFL
jgi:hypothetical protein